MQALAERLTQRDMNGKDNIAEVFIDGLRSCARGEEDEFVDTFLEEKLPEELRRDRGRSLRSWPGLWCLYCEPPSRASTCS
jgi:hypothetical protein